MDRRRPESKKFYKRKRHIPKKGTAFICAPFPGEIFNNVCAAVVIARRAHAAGYSAIIPHLNFLYLNPHDPQEDGAAIKYCLDVIPKCEVFIYSSAAGVTKHMRAEIEKAEAEKIVIINADNLPADKKTINGECIGIIRKLIKTPFGGFEL